MSHVKSIGLLSLLILLLTLALGGSAAAAPASPPDLGPNVIIFDPSMTTAEIQAAADAIYAQQVDDEMGPNRYALLFMPGTYGSAATPLLLKVGYYTEVAGLGLLPSDVVINGHVDVYNRCLEPNGGNCLALVNFWRSLSNLTIQVQSAGMDGCRASANFWAVSQASPMRRVNITGGNLSLMDYCTGGPQYASGGFIADSDTTFVVNGSQQQFMVRDSIIDGWSNAVWNQVFSGVIGAPANSFGSTPYDPPPYTTLDESPITREKPFLYVDGDGAFNVFVPAPRTDSSGTTWSARPTSGRSIPLADFFLAQPGDSVKEINQALRRGKHLLFTPGVYDIDSKILVNRKDTVVLGMGLATLTPTKGNLVMRLADAPRITVAGLMFDAGPQNSYALLQVGTRGVSNGRSDPAYPTLLADVFFRIGGPHVGKATTSLLVNSDDVILDHIWAWRADHGIGVSWTDNTADTGVIVNGDRVTAYGLFVEHYQKYETIWNGEYGRTIFFQNELPYDPPSQAAWQHDGVNGYAAYKVGEAVEHHEAWGLGSYSYFNQGVDIHAERAFEVPVTPGVKFHSLVTVYLNGSGGIDHVINDTGAPVFNFTTNQVSNVVSYP
ncbi:conserved exported protein of unknown function [Candidatus Promineifilum breve]|uniref:Adenylyl cyclase n=1 Tax=Candidatus Promineifilum breve TaxID=1806508 RepID=A0A160T7F5_9CHLR|nr:adenylyl cyclase [Candidatus Promineifilum breve]CUS05569.1 conserved exported protein of unknown function [Candidatus Promineifilum breve]